MRITRVEKAKAAKTWENALIGYVMDGKPRFMEMTNYVRRRWNHIQTPKVTMLQEGVFLFDFPSKEKQMEVLEKRWFYNERPLILRPWTPNLNLNDLSIKKVPVWIQLTKLPLDLWGPEIIEKLASYIGTPIATDKLTANRDRLAYARILVDVEIKAQQPRSIPVHSEEGVYYQPVHYEWRPEHCTKCGRYGHGQSVCDGPTTMWNPKPNQPKLNQPEQVQSASHITPSEAASSSNSKENAKLSVVQAGNSKQQLKGGNASKSVEVDQNRGVVQVNTGSNVSANAIDGSMLPERGVINLETIVVGKAAVPIPPKPNG